MAQTHYSYFLKVDPKSVGRAEHQFAEMEMRLRPDGGSDVIGLRSWNEGTIATRNADTTD